jgi:hypothetical protein
MTTLSATTGRFVRVDQRDKIGQILKIPWSVVQMNMGFGKSSVIVPMLVARYICKRETKVVFVTQPLHLVPQAARTVGALIAAHPYVRGIDGSVTAVRTLNGSDMMELITNKWKSNIDTGIGQAHEKYVVVLSTADLQCIVRDYPGIYGASRSIVHIADEVDAESDPLKCEVIIEGPEKKQHYNERVATQITGYYQAACDLVFEAKQENVNKSVAAVDGLCDGDDIKAGTRLSKVHGLIKKNMSYRVNFGMSDDPDKIVAVPYDYSGTPSQIREFSDIDVAIIVLVMSISLGMRDSDMERLRVDIVGRYGENADSIMRYFEQDHVLMKRFYLMQMALKHIKMSTEEIAVSFVDLLGMAGTLVGFSGTMGTSIEAPRFEQGDERERFSENKVPVIDDKASNDRVRSLISNAKFIFVHGEQGTKRAEGVIAKIAEDVNGDDRDVCIVDGSGEFGVFQDDVAELQKTWRNIEYFDAATGMRKRKKQTRTVLYYSHRNSRGTDSEMSESTIGRTIVSWDTSRESDVAQAIYRLRKLDKGQKVALVVVSKSELGDKNKTGEAVLGRLGQNERAYAASAADTKAVQMGHASSKKRGKQDFKRKVVYTDVASVGAQKHQEQQAQNLVLVQNVEMQTTGLERREQLECYEKTKDSGYDKRELSLLGGRIKTEISSNLKKTNIALSPMITDRSLGDPKKAMRRAFALSKWGVLQNVPRITVTVITIVEAWATYKRQSAERYAYYTHDGKFIHGNRELQKDQDTKGAVLLGRYLCDDGLSISDEIGLLVYLEKIYRTADEMDGLRKVLECLHESKFIEPGRSLLLYGMVDDGNTAGSILENAKANVDRLIERAASNNKDLYTVLEPIIRGALGNTNSFGKPRRRSLGSFV